MWIQMTTGNSHSYRKSGSGWLRTAIISVAVIGLVSYAIFQVTRKQSVSESSSANPNVKPLTILCAAGMKKAVLEVKDAYEKEFGLPVNLTYGSSGQLEGQLRIHAQGGISQADLFIPADESFSMRTRREGLTSETLHLAEFRVVLALSPNPDTTPETIDELLSSGLAYTLCDPKAGAGQKTMESLVRTGQWDEVRQRAKAVFPTVTEAANAIKTSDNIQAGFIWNSVARQFGLEFIELSELQGSNALITVNVVSSSTQPTRALHFARYLTAPDRGIPAFEKHFFDTRPGDPWSDQPEILVFAGGVNRDAVDETIREFESREGCVVQVQYAGCGTLVGNIQTGSAGVPNVFLTCDASYMDKVGNLFGDAANVSSTKICILVRGGNPMNIRSVRDLANPQLKIGTTDPRLSTLGFLSWELFRKFGVHDAISSNKSVVVTTPTAHELIAQVQTHGKLDAALVYEANCQNLTGEFELIPIDHPVATAVQNIASSRENRYPELSKRLMDAVLSADSSKRFASKGFQWLGSGSENPGSGQ